MLATQQPEILEKTKDQGSGDLDLTPKVHSSYIEEDLILRLTLLRKSAVWHEAAMPAALDPVPALSHESGNHSGHPEEFDDQRNLPQRSR